MPDIGRFLNFKSLFAQPYHSINPFARGSVVEPFAMVCRWKLFQ